MSLAFHRRRDPRGALASPSPWLRRLAAASARPLAATRLLAAVVAVAAPVAAHAKPIAFQGGTAVMAEYGGPTMQEAQAFYAPSFRWSAGVGQLRLEAEDESFSRRISYARGNALLKRWNLPRAQANLFGWGGVGVADGRGFAGERTAWNAGGQADYETLRLYSSLRTDFHHARGAFAHRIDTAQLGVAPYAHDWDRLATWLLVQGRAVSGGVEDGVEASALLRLFKNGRRGAVWTELGVSQDGDLQAMLMINF